METGINTFTQQYINKQVIKTEEIYNDVIEISDSNEDEIEQKMCNLQNVCYDERHQDLAQNAISYEDPIDLSYNCQPTGRCRVIRLIPTDQSTSQTSQMPLPMSISTGTPDSRQCNTMTLQCVPRPRVRKRKFCDGMPQFVMDGRFDINGENNSSESKQIEVLNAAKSLFSKRTRTLYHWLYPNAPKAQIKVAVASSWESLGVQEKQFYISQVLGRFGFPQCNLMINPQLGGIKQLPPLPEVEFRQTPNELQDAISSIAPTGFSEVKDSSKYVRRKKRQGRPPGSKNKKPAKAPNYTICQDFQDDPELSKELEQFALTLNMNDTIGAHHLKF